MPELHGQAIEPDKRTTCAIGLCDGSGDILSEETAMPTICPCVYVMARRETRKRFLGERFYTIKLEDISPRTDKQKRLRSLLLAKPEAPIFLTGIGDRGKTHFLAAVYNYWDDRKAPIKYLDDGMLKDELRQAELNGDYGFIRDLLANFKYIFLDDVNKEKVSDFYRSALYRLFNELYKNKRHIFITANDSLKTLGQSDMWGPSVARRVEDLCEIVEF